MATSHGEAVDGTGISKRHRFRYEIADRVGAVAVGHLVEALIVAARGHSESRTLRSVTSELFKSGGSGRVENRVGLLVTVGARLALEPKDVTPSVEYHVEGLDRLADADAGEVLAASLAYARRDRRGQVLGSDLRLHGLQIRPVNLLQCKLELGVERVDSGRVAVESGED